MHSTDIACRRYRGCNRACFHVEEITDGLVHFRVNGRGTRISIDLDTLAALMRHELPDEALKGHGD
jgi:hypothetical protein